MEYCLFCNRDDLDKDKTIIENHLFYAIWDKNPVSEGHALVIPKRHTKSFFDLIENDVLQLFILVKKVKQVIDEKYMPDSYNIGINDGLEAGQSIHHLHVHIIPRYKGDVENPRGGVRHIILGKGNY